MVSVQLATVRRGTENSVPDINHGLFITTRVLRRKVQVYACLYL